MSSRLHRKSTIGSCLMETLSELMSAGKITEEAAEKVMTQFDKITYTALETKVQTKATLKGNLKTYRHLDNVWTFVLDNVTLKLSAARSETGSEEHMQSAKLVCVDSKLIQKEREDREVLERDAEIAAQQAAMTETKLIKTEPGLYKKEEQM